MANASIHEDDNYDDRSELGVDSDEESNFDSSADRHSSERQNMNEGAGYSPVVGATADVKARDTGVQQSSTSATPTSSQLNHFRTQAFMSWTDGPGPANEAPPPDYEAATAAARTASQPSRHRHAEHTEASYRPYAPSSREGLRLIPSNSQHRPHGADTAIESAVNHGHAQPQSMRDAQVPTQINGEQIGLLTGKDVSRQRSRRFCGSRWCKSLLACIAVIAAVILILVCTLAGTSSSGRRRDGGGGSPAGGDGGRGNHGTPVDAPIAIMPPTTQCPYKNYVDAEIYEFRTVSSFSFQEFLESDRRLSGGIRGTLNISPAGEDQTSDIKLSLYYATTSTLVVTGSNVIQTDESFTLHLPEIRRDGQPWSDHACLQIFARIEVRPGLRLQNWEATTSLLNIEVEDGLFDREQEELDATGYSSGTSVLQLTGSSMFSSVAGKANIAYWSSRETVIDMISGTIKGTFALRDLLSLKTQSGAISANVEPQGAASDHIKPADFLAQSNSGHIDITFPQSGYIPLRDYRTRVETMSAGISGSYIHGSLTYVRTTSGGINLALLPFLDVEAGRRASSNLHTETYSGSTRLTILPPYNDNGESWASQHPAHKSKAVSGSIEVAYPQQWTGKVVVDSISGGVKIKGRDVEIIKDEKQYGQRHVLAKKGDGDGRIALESMSGHISASIGNS